MNDALLWLDERYELINDNQVKAKTREIIGDLTDAVESLEFMREGLTNDLDQLDYFEQKVDENPDILQHQIGFDQVVSEVKSKMTNKYFLDKTVEAVGKINSLIHE